MSKAISTKKDFISVEEYLAFEERSKYRHEYLDGEIFQMAGGKYNHSLISTNIITEISINLRSKNKNCDVHGSDLRVKVDEDNYVYLDVVVVCNPKLVPNIFDTLENPQIIFEITSKSTEFRDKETKLKIYLEISSLTDYLIVSQKESRIEHYQRKSLKEWTYRVYSKPDEVIQLESIEGELTVEQTYRTVEFPVKLKIVKTKKK
jgi:Uma2 family endonuclease